MTTLIEKVITRALDKQQKNVFNIVSGNFEISKQQIAELEKEINESRQSIEHTKLFYRQGSTGGREFRTYRESRAGYV